MILLLLYNKEGTFASCLDFETYQIANNSQIFDLLDRLLGILPMIVFEP
jgi:hypothetical protein